MKKKKRNVIYSITNKVNGKEYIGSAVNYDVRVKRHIYELRNDRHHSSRLQNSFNKHGENNFYFSIIEEVDDIEKLITTEQKWLDNRQPEYNMTLIAGLNCHIGLIRSDETKRKISEALTGIKRSDETKRKISEAKMGVSIDGTNMNKDKIGVPLSNEHKEKISKGNKGKTVTKETKNKISKTLKDKNMKANNGICVEQYNLDGILINVFTSLDKAEKGNNIGRGLLHYHLIKRDKKKYRDFIWKIIKK